MTDSDPDSEDDPPGDGQGHGGVRRRDNLMLRIAALLTLALLPIGALAIIQTTNTAARVDAENRRDLLAQLNAYAQPERDAIQEGFGLARGLAAVMAVQDPSGAECSALMQRAQQDNPRFHLVGFIDSDLQSGCNSAGRAFDFSDNARARQFINDPRPFVSFNPQGAVSDKPVITLSEPVNTPDGVFLGYVSMSFMQQLVNKAQRITEEEGGRFFLTFDARGNILSASSRVESIEDSLPAAGSLAEFGAPEADSFVAEGRDGAQRFYAVTPVVDGTAYAMAGWTRDAMEARPARLSMLAFPALMWLVSVLVAVLTIRRLVAVPLATLGRRMRSFADSRRFAASDNLARAPTELRTINDSFEDMANHIIRDEADQENRLHERDMMLREIHHRVKNNLQLMSSILNMQTRRTRSSEVTYALRSLQKRLTSLATVHQALYEEPSIASVRADQLLDGLIRQLASLADADAGMRVDRNLAPIRLVPDQAAPLAMLVTEAFSNAIKYHGPDGTGQRYVAVSLEETRPGVACLRIVNSLSAPLPDAAQSGLGTQLIRAFGVQLGDDMQVASDADRYALTVSFEIEGSKPE